MPDLKIVTLPKKFKWNDDIVSHSCSFLFLLTVDVGAFNNCLPQPWVIDLRYQGLGLSSFQWRMDDMSFDSYYFMHTQTTQNKHPKRLKERWNESRRILITEEKNRIGRNGAKNRKVQATVQTLQTNPPTLQSSQRIRPWRARNVTRERRVPGKASSLHFLRIVLICLDDRFDRVDRVDNHPVKEPATRYKDSPTLTWWIPKWWFLPSELCFACNRNECTALERVHIYWSPTPSRSNVTSQIAVPGISLNSVSDSPRKRLRTPSFFTASRMTLNEVDLRVDFEDCSIWSRHR